MKALLVLALVAAGLQPVWAAEEKSEASGEEQVKLQVFLDEAGFSPGKIDGKEGEFTEKALKRYQQAQGTEAGGDWKQLAADLEPFTEYTVTEDDLKLVGEKLPEEPEQKAELKELPYGSLVEVIAEKFHADEDYVRELNPEIASAKAGTTLKVPNVTPFEFAEVQKLGKDSDRKKEEKEAASEPSEKDAEAAEAATADKADRTATGGGAQKIHIDLSEKMLELREGEKIVAAYPITPGSDQTPAPKGEWKIQDISHMPWFRWDEKMLKEGERSEDAHNLPPGPNSPVGIVWMGLNKKGVGIHGTEAPDTIGRSASAGCIRLANWDAFELSQRVKEGTVVTIQ